MSYSMRSVSLLMKKEVATSLFFIRVFSSIGFGLLYSSLALYLIKNLHLSESFAMAFTGIFIALHYSLATLSGIVLGRWISYINALILGNLLQMLSLPLIYEYHSMLFWGCSLFLLGSLSSSAAINMIITERFEPKDQRRERIFMWNYAGMNLGNILGFSIAGYFQLLNDFKNVSHIAIGLMLISFILCLVYKKKLADIHSDYTNCTTRIKRVNFLKLLGCLILLGILIKSVLFYSIETSTILIIVLTIAFIGFLTFNFIRAQDKTDALIFIALAISYLLFWSLYFLIPTGLTIFVSYNTSGHLFGFVTPPAWLPNINSIIIIVGAPLIGLLFKKLDAHGWTPIHKFIVGLLYLSIAFIPLDVGIFLSHLQLVNLAWVALCYVLLSLSELFIAPVGFASVGQYVDRKLQSLMTGLWIGILGFGGLIASKLSSVITITGSSLHQSNKQFLILFTGLFLFSIVCCGLLYLFKVLGAQRIQKMLSVVKNI